MSDIQDFSRLGMTFQKFKTNSTFQDLMWSPVYNMTY